MRRTIEQDSNESITSVLKRPVFALLIGGTIVSFVAGLWLATFLAPQHNPAKEWAQWPYGVFYFAVAVLSNVVAAGALFLLGYYYLERYRHFTAGSQFNEWVVRPLSHFIRDEVVSRLEPPLLDVHRKDELNWADCIKDSNTIVICVQGWDWLISHNETAFTRFFERGGCVKIILPDQGNRTQMESIRRRLKRQPDQQSDEISETIRLLQSSWAEGHKKNQQATVELYKLKGSALVWYFAAKFDDRTLVISPYDNIRLGNGIRAPFIRIPLNKYENVVGSWISTELDGLMKDEYSLKEVWPG